MANRTAAAANEMAAASNRTARAALGEARETNAITVALAAERRLEVTLQRAEAALERLPELEASVRESSGHLLDGRKLLALENWEQARETFDAAVLSLARACVAEDVFCDLVADFRERVSP